MTINSSRRVSTRRPIGFRAGRGGSGSGGDGRSPVGEQLREAREGRGLDLHRVERDTKIRSKYIEAMESGDFADLPGEVYTRGFLRNYATYLGLDADEIVDAWRREAGAPVPVKAMFVGPQPMTIRRGVVFQRSHAIILVVVLIVAAVGSYFGYQVTRFLQYPTVGVSDPSGVQTLQVPAGTTGYVLKGTATAGTNVLISWDGQDPTNIAVDDSGHWVYSASLHFGSNQFDITAKNLDTNHASPTSRIIIVVPVVTPSPPAPSVVFVSPADGTVTKDGAVSVTGTSTLVGSVTITSTYLGPPPAPGATLPPTLPSGAPGASPAAGASPAPGASAGPNGSPGPAPTTVRPGGDGSFAFDLQLTPGRWQLTIVGLNALGSPTPSVSRTIAVPYQGLNVTIQITGAGTLGACISYFVDGVQTQGCSADGYQITVTPSKTFCIYVKNRPSVVFLSLNGAPLGSVSQFGGNRVYIDFVKPPRNVSTC